MTRIAILLSIQALVLVGCSLLQAPDDSTVGGSRPLESIEPSTGPGKPAPGSPTGAVVSGTLGFDAVEGGCAYLETADGTRFQVIYPDGWRIDRASGHLLGPSGEDAGPGDKVSVRGSVATDMASTCQIGPMFRATAVLSAGE